MSNPIPARPFAARGARSVLVLALSLLVVPALAGCAAGPAPAAATAAAPGSGATAPTPGAASGNHVMPNGSRMSDADMTAAWAARPAYVRKNQRTESAYAFALQTGNVIEWMPCYCGCDAMDHRSNLDCYLKPAPGSRVAWEEHASFCQICVDITLTAKKLLGEGKSLLAIRQAVDRTYGSAGPGTDTALPAS